jgi:hypothetical protein
MSDSIFTAPFKVKPVINWWYYQNLDEKIIAYYICPIHYSEVVWQTQVRCDYGCLLDWENCRELNKENYDEKEDSTDDEMEEDMEENDPCGICGSMNHKTGDLSCED